ncbi:vomeronasal type-2 receptor 26-like [Lissotriton helveticus]
MPFGLCNAPAAFQYFMDEVLRGLLDTICMVYIDDILVYSRTLLEHVEHVREVLGRLQQHDLYAKLEKCLFHMPEVSFLGYVINANGFQMEDDSSLCLQSEPPRAFISDFTSNLPPVCFPLSSQIPRSVCSESCPPGYRKAPIEGRPICCFDCVPCAEGEFSVRTDVENCLKCPEDKWPNERKDGCIPKTIVFLPYNDVLGETLVFAALSFSIATAAVLGIFIRHRDTPIVKANNRELSYTLLAALMLAFLCSLLFIGRPGTWTCLIQQAAFGIIFTVAVSCVLAKTITVVIAFNATRPGSRLSRWLGSRVSRSIVLLSTLGEVTICLSWLLTSPPHPGTDTQSETGKIILQCDQGSAAAYYSVIGYMALLAFASFVVAFLARNLPDRFNEAKLITFSMLVFCSVWVSFIPAYLSTKGRNMVAVEIFAILSSTAGLLGCIFCPKCYTIFRMDRNRIEHLDLKCNL